MTYPRALSCCTILPQGFTVVKLPRRVARQTLMREQLFEISAGNIGQQHAAQRGTVHRQTGTNADPLIRDPAALTRAM